MKDKIFEFLPILKRLYKKGVCGKWEGGKDQNGIMQMPYCVLPKEIEEFIRTCHIEGIIKENYREVLNKNYNSEQWSKDMTDAEIDELDEDTTKCIITGIIMQERFCEGTINEMILSGLMYKLVNHLQYLSSKDN